MGIAERAVGGAGYVASEDDQALMAGYAFNVVPRGYDPMEVQRALLEYGRYVEGLKVQLAEARTELEQVRSNSRAVREDVYAEFGSKVATVMEAAKKQAVQVIKDARQQAVQTIEEAKRQAETSLTAARIEAGETVAAARREASLLRERAQIQIQREEDETLKEIQATAEGLLEGVTLVKERLVPELTEMRERLNEIGMELQENIRRPLAEGASPNQPALQLPARDRSRDDSDLAPTPAPQYGAYALDDPELPTGSGADGNGLATKAVRLEDFDERWFDDLWRQA